MNQNNTCERSLKVRDELTDFLLYTAPDGAVEVTSRSQAPAWECRSWRLQPPACMAEPCENAFPGWSLGTREKNN